MILVDTNVLSEPMRSKGDPRVSDWLDRQAAETLFISTVTVAELLFGVAALPRGDRRSRLGRAIEEQLMRLFAGRILAFDLDAARAYASIMGVARAKGLAISRADGQIAAIATANALFVATRDQAPFRAAGLRTVNPWVD